ncbi:MAG TPA: SDR family NAD(P)-dependent oxidoreductase [Candidatus Saccharimonadales bacterium]|nr:SDR family NAD(P)-dependent oxidoreductase [Candidatus Saccharimonadales bacterium]
MDIKGKVILITGASEGIGKVTAELLSSKGAKVAAAARSRDKLEKLVSSLKDAFVIPVDMTVAESISDMINGVHKHYGRIDILINNAGQAVRAPVTDIKIEDFKKIMELNVYGPLRALQAVVPIMKAQGGGMIINVSSNVSKMAIPGIGAYAATKYALNGLMLTARNELASEGIVVTLMHPGLTDTNFGIHSIRSSEVEFTRPAGMQPDAPERVAEKILEAISRSPAEQYMSKEIEKQYATK